MVRQVRQYCIHSSDYLVRLLAVPALAVRSPHPQVGVCSFENQGHTKEHTTLILGIVGTIPSRAPCTQPRIAAPSQGALHTVTLVRRRRGDCGRGGGDSGGCGVA